LGGVGAAGAAPGNTFRGLLLPMPILAAVAIGDAAPCCGMLGGVPDPNTFSAAVGLGGGNCAVGVPGCDGGFKDGMVGNMTCGLPPPLMLVICGCCC